MMLLDVIETLNGALQGQPFIIVFLVACLAIVGRMYLKVLNEKEEITNKVIKLATIWEEKTSKDSEDSKENLELNKEILRVVREIKDAINNNK